MAREVDILETEITDIIKPAFLQLFSNPIMKVQLDLDLKKLTELAFQMQDHDKKLGRVVNNKSNMGGWHSNNILEEKHEELIRLKKEITQHLQTYHSEVFRGMIFRNNVIQNINDMWVNINEKYHYNEWHIHPGSVISGAYYIKHDGCNENGAITFKHSNGTYKNIAHWPAGLIESENEVTGEIVQLNPEPNMLLLFPGWLEHKAEINLKDDTRISSSFNSRPILEKTKQQWQGNIWR